MIYLELFLTFLKIGAFTFGGGYAMIPLIEEQVTRFNGISSEDIIDFIAISESTPGPIAVNMATYVGSEVGGFFGAVCATLGITLPSFIVILIVAKFFQKFSSNKAVKGLMSGLKPAVVGLIASAVVSVGMTVFMPGGFTFEIFRSISFYMSLAIFVLCLVLAFRKLHPILIILISAILGIIYGYLFL